MDFDYNMTFIDKFSDNLIIPVCEVFNVTDGCMHILYKVINNEGKQQGMRTRSRTEFMNKIQNKEYLQFKINGVYFTK